MYSLSSRPDHYWRIGNVGTGPLTVSVGSPKHSSSLTELGGGAGIIVLPGPAHNVTIVYLPTIKGSTKDSISITSDGDPTQADQGEVLTI